LGSGDVTTKLTVSPNIKGKAVITAKENGVMAGGIVVEKIFKTIDKNIKYKQFVSEGTKFKKGEDVCKIEGKLCSILQGERTALNFLSILSGIASLTNKFVEKVKPTKVKILDTRKTLPGLRELSKYAVKCGGGKNHRKGLWDMILIKDNHIEASGGIGKAIYKIQDTRCKMQDTRCKIQGTRLKTEIEVKNLSELKIALGSKIDRIMLDNMDVKGMREAVKLARKVNPKIELEASGGVNLENVYDIAKTGVDYISVGAITHSAKAIDFSLNVEMEKSK